ncbi:mRNA-degrading endonuclease RelE of RelBE toxin-antitoxin system [Breznakia sp. PF5-3]|uniref:ribonuclease E inhibitor RraB n=1 Tax=unclassified Breznakia TaxID=2623764 RepID=UPI002404F976|nr:MULTISPECIES: ribonuclease E inhibitor RraB [unclassified Breznakia]MDL2276311.1 ribonuclease E inhibitor RraB [Breznakia sp. OttesenSCG-928-G09]MDF9825140.1 mRNA-degrading endonuclease RelE of RelBE toxin-antitoxin system [Breznakia sp. PM6-1]MDF9836001.1 mRNA-degrading endonuclease RelE of RelBE toxin-antitoxin system [Breznakia sp. PF5-3]MDF9838099.1 mRNA-degrading endonuclease RelE of RelBE toxin-antitoxin system [Breznakia sp. PFB2-8]MDF9860071.1 mRNA-degrading endonuclease RelE of Rel
MKKTLGLLAVVGAAAAVVAYKMKKDEVKKDIKQLDEDNGERILRTVEEQGFEPIDYDSKPEPFSAKTFPHLEEKDIIEITKASEEEFKKLGDVDVNEERPIQHNVKFKKEIDLEEFKNIVIGEGYVVTNGEGENELLILHISKMDQDDISSKVFYLADLAKAHDGEYNGWICKQ